MLRIHLYLDDNDCLKGLSAHGHSGLADKGEDILCAAVSAVLRTTAKLISANHRIISEGKAGQPGELELRVHFFPVTETEWIRGITDFCNVSLFDLMDEYPAGILVSRNRGEAPALEKKYK